MAVMAGIGVVKTEEEPDEEVGISATLLFSTRPAKSTIERVKEEIDLDDDADNATTSDGTSVFDDAAALCNRVLQQSKERSEQKRKLTKSKRGDRTARRSCDSTTNLRLKWSAQATVERNKYEMLSADQADIEEQSAHSSPPQLIRQICTYRCGWNGCKQEFTSPSDVRAHYSCQHDSSQSKKRAKLNSPTTELEEAANCQTRMLTILRRVRQPIGAHAEPPELQAEETRMITVVRRPDDPTTSHVAIMPKLQPTLTPTPNELDDSCETSAVLPVPWLPFGKNQSKVFARQLYSCDRGEKKSKKASNEVVAKLTANIFKAADALERTKQCQTISPPLRDAIMQTEQDLTIRQIKVFEERALSQQSKRKTPRTCNMASSVINSVHRYFIQRGSPMSVRETAAACGVCIATVRRALAKGQPKDEDDRYMLEMCPVPLKDLRKWNEEKGIYEPKAREIFRNKSKALVLSSHRWSFFKRDPENVERRTQITGGVCCRCNKLVAAKCGNTSGLLLHLKNYHTNDDYPTLLELEKAHREKYNHEDEDGGSDDDDDDEDNNEEDDDDDDGNGDGYVDDVDMEEEEREDGDD